ncbi:LexA family transcriptional regulator [Alteraurantiacibacter palmitatis]|uniref:LexA repressor DNA-binding domain-containing protein n=1 Tax=Alteraurantiacibacter palmitatis TaxID=2054628 RepID=A0ABV7E4E9_9SPHN
MVGGIGFDAQSSDDELRRLVPEMVSFKLLVLGFVRHYIATRGGSPSLGEIAAHTGSNRKRVRNAVLKLANEGLLLRRPGERGLSLPDIEADAVRQLRQLGWTVEESARIVARRVTIHPLSTARVLDYSPQGSEGEIHGEAQIGREKRKRRG